jgi:hypothetical protein
MIEVYDCEQGSPEWFACRAGIPTASEFATVMAKGRTKGETSKTRRTYMLKLIGERLTGEPMYNYQNDHMERGKEMEGEARAMYEMIRDVDTARVGFVRNGEKGASPDSLIGNDGMLEIKTKLPHLQLDLLLSGDFPSEHMAQCQGQLWVAEREWVDFCSYWPKLRPFVIRVHRNDTYIKNLSAEVDAFLSEMHELMERVQAEPKKEAA